MQKFVCRDLKEGDWFDCSIGGILDPASTRVEVRAQFLRRGTASQWPGEGKTAAVLIHVNGIDILITEVRTCITTKKTFFDFGLNFGQYKIIVLKLGYLWPDFDRFHQIAIDELNAFDYDKYKANGFKVEHLDDCGCELYDRPVGSSPCASDVQAIINTYRKYPGETPGYLRLIL